MHIVLGHEIKRKIKSDINIPILFYIYFRDKIVLIKLIQFKILL